MTLQQEPVPAASSLTHAVDILAFVEAQEIPPDYFETPYFLAPEPGGEKDYALLRETLRRTRKIGIAYVVIQARQHLAALIPHGQSLVLNTLRWNTEDRERARTAREAVAVADPARAPIERGTTPPLQRMRVTGCEDFDPDDLEELLEESLFDCDDVIASLMRPRLHYSVPPAGRGTTLRQPLGAARPRRFARRA
ncbi:MAG TPA: Ku protein [Noviherbaspirillum sp.]|nr:Ku protein [Noviherbaspirillum sp.]